MAHISSTQVFLGILPEVWDDGLSTHSQQSFPRRPPSPSLSHVASLQSLFALGPAEYLFLLYHVAPNSGVPPSSVRFNFFSTCSGKILFLTKFPLSYSQGKCILSLAPLKIEVNDFSRPFCRFSYLFHQDFPCHLFLLPPFPPQPSVSSVQDIVACFEQFFIVSPSGVLIRD